MLEVKVTEAMLTSAKNKAAEQGKLKRSFMEGEGNVVGYLGEEIFAKAYPNVERKNGYHSDFIFNGEKIDIKSKKCKSKPKVWYECSIVAYSLKTQKNDRYVFIRVRKDLSMGWILGTISKEDFIARSHFMRKGRLDISNNYKVKEDCYNLKISDLEPEGGYFGIISQD